ncbi:M48 family metalloprotease [Nocardiopsis sp. RSe5-2]|uniref:M48 family metalloprotease n=1 Tax=Nocardiopsis endophytica TaxID=3018445 RepID=A0ABT4U4J8_9ACTN|nr:M48 family metalloprotease [Nocardiopsis endophytica]MDA2811869.1 M48 family metalloprotease [Nocardiopsis endophytica]
MRRRAPSALGPLVRAGAAVVAVVAFYTGLACWAAAAIGLPWWSGIVPVALMLLGSDYFHREVLGAQLAERRPEPVGEEDDPRLHAVADRLAALTGLAKPTFRSFESPAPHAFTLTHPPSGDGPTVFLSSGLRERLANAELEAVLAHEYAHIAHRDQRLLDYAGSMSHWTAYLPLLLTQRLLTVDAPLCRLAHRCGRRWLPFGAGRQQVEEFLENAPAATLPRPVAAVVIALVAVARGLFVALVPVVGAAIPVVTAVGIVLALPGFYATAALTRHRELAADAAAARTTGAPSALVSALSELTGEMESIPQRDLRKVAGVKGQGIVPVDPPPQSTLERVLGWFILLPLMDSHPPLRRRTARLERLGRSLNGPPHTSGNTPVSMSKPNGSGR